VKDLTEQGPRELVLVIDNDENLYDMADNKSREFWEQTFIFRDDQWEEFIYRD